MFTIIIFILVLGLLVLVHELGHFVAAKKAGCNVEEFGIGFPPKLFTIKKGGTKYCINLLPIGGYVKIQGEDGEDSSDPRSFANKSAAWKALIVTAGVLMNVFLAYVLITIGLMVGTPTIIDGEEDEFGRFAHIGNKQVQVIQVLDDTPADAADLKIMDTILAVNDVEISNVDQVQATLSAEPIQPVDLLIKRGSETIVINVTPEELDEVGKVGVGIGLAETARISYPWYIAWLYGIQRTFLMLFLILQAFAVLIGQLFSGAGISAEIAGPVGIAVLTGEMAKIGFTQLMQFVAVLSLNLAIINILPFPALDGARLVFVILEKIRRKKLNVLVERWINVVGFGLLMLLMVAITIKDVFDYGGGIWESFKGLFT